MSQIIQNVNYAVAMNVSNILSAFQTELASVITAVSTQSQAGGYISAINASTLTTFSTAESYKINDLLADPNIAYLLDTSGNCIIFKYYVSSLYYNNNPANLNYCNGITSPVHNMYPTPLVPFYFSTFFQNNTESGLVGPTTYTTDDTITNVLSTLLEVQCCLTNVIAAYSVLLPPQ